MDEGKDLDITQNIEEAAAKSRETSIKKGWGGFSAWELNDYKERMHSVYDRLKSTVDKKSTPDSATQFQHDAEGEVKLQVLKAENNDPTHTISDPNKSQIKTEESDSLKKAA